MNILTDQDLERLETSYRCRSAIVENIFKDGIPNKVSVMETINKILDSMDKSIYDRANIKLKHEENQNKEAILDIITETLTNISKQNIQVNRDTELDNEYIPDDIVDGETDIQPDQITLTDIVEEEQ